MTATQLAPVQEKLQEKITPAGEFLDSTSLRNAPQELRRRLADSGYLFLRGLVDRVALEQLRREILELCREHGWLLPGAPLLDGVYSGIPFPDYRLDYIPMYRKLIKLESFNAFARSKELMALFGQLLEGAVLCHPRTIARVSFPRHYANTTQAHQDFYYIKGTPDTYTAWLPAGDCPRELGGLALLEGSNKLAFLPHVPAIGAGGNGVKTADLGLRWLAADFNMGDVVIFHSHTIHGALENHTPDRLRISLDYRYQRANEEVSPSSLKPHLG